MLAARRAVSVVRPRREASVVVPEEVVVAHPASMPFSGIFVPLASVIGNARSLG
jgi:hypothetical protein